MGTFAELFTAPEQHELEELLLSYELLDLQFLSQLDWTVFA